MDKVMKKVSIIINGVRYDAVDSESIPNQKCICGYCDICGLIPNFPCSSIIGSKRVFKKSDKKLGKMKLKKLLNMLWYVKVELFVLSLFALCFLVAKIEKGITETKNKKERIGETIVLFGDTLTIKEYNTDCGYYILSNGTIYEKQ